MTSGTHTPLGSQFEAAPPIGMKVWSCLHRLYLLGDLISSDILKHDSISRKTRGQFEQNQSGNRVALDTVEL